MRPKEIRERDIIEFWDHLNRYPGTEPQKQSPPEPDFFIETSDGLIGVEHTSLTHEIDANGVDIVMHNVLSRKICNRAWQNFKEDSDAQLHVTLVFECTYGLSVPGEPVYLAGDDVDRLSNFICDFVDEHHPKEPNGSIEFNWREELPPKIHSISIWNTSHMDTECWSEISGGSVPILAQDHLQESIDRKNTKPDNYTKEYFATWLVLVENKNRHHTYLDIENSGFQGHQYSSEFDKVFVYRKHNNQIFDLQIE